MHSDGMASVKLLLLDKWVVNFVGCFCLHFISELCTMTYFEGHVSMFI